MVFLQRSNSVNNPHTHILEKSARVMGVGGDEISQYYPSIKLLERTINKYPWEKIISHEYTIENVHKAMDVAMCENSMKVILSPWIKYIFQIKSL